jgi:nucleotide-binding universal stress UspA family protein
MARIDVNHILCPVDLSEPSRDALRQAGMLARWYGSKITVLEVLWETVPPVPPLPYGPTSAPTPAEQRDAMAEELRRFVESSRVGGVEIAAKVLDGPVVSRIVQEASQLPADLVVMGTHGATGFERLVLGSVTEKVLRKAPCPVLTVPPAAPGALEPVPFKTILCAVDFSPPSLAGLKFAFSLAEESGGRLIALYVIDWSIGHPLPDDRELDRAALGRHLEEEAQRELSAALTVGAPDAFEVRQVIATGKPHEEILRVAGEQHADVIVMGVHGRGAISLAFFGSTANQVVRAAACPVLTVRT